MNNPSRRILIVFPLYFHCISIAFLLHFYCIFPGISYASESANYKLSQLTINASGSKQQSSSLTNSTSSLAEGVTSTSISQDYSLKSGYIHSIFPSDAITLIKAKDGGEVISPDKRIKVMIPKDALLADAWMSISNLEVSVYQKAAPNDYALYLIADFKPGNILFYKPVKIIFTLPQPQVPGTPVYLGLYNEQEGKLTLEEIKSFVSADGVTVEFLVTHFSTYAAMKGLISQGAPIGASTKTPLPDLFTGSFSHSIPIAVPPGRKGIQPGLTFQYRSSNPNSWTGVGWALNTGYITRQPKKGLPKYDDTKDIFTFVSDSFSTELVYLIDNLYQAKIEGAFMKFFKEPNDTWKVISKDGSILLFGATPESKETGLNNKTFNYYLTKASDPNTNYISYEYTKNEGKSYLNRIFYTGNDNGSTSPRYRVDFYLSDRTDTQASYASGEKISATKRLDRIEAYFDSSLVWKYQFDYGYSADTGRSLLKSFTQYTADGKAFPAQVFEY